MILSNLYFTKIKSLFKKSRGDVRPSLRRCSAAIRPKKPSELQQRSKDERAKIPPQRCERDKITQEMTNSSS